MGFIKKEQIPKSGVIPTCPFTAEEICARSEHDPKYSTLKYLREKAVCGIDFASLETYRELEAATSKIRFSKFVSVRFSNSLTDVCLVQSAIREVKHKINKFFFRGKPSPLRFLFIIEPDKILHNGLTALHFHYLITTPSDCELRLSQLPKALCLTYDKIDRLIKQEDLSELLDEDKLKNNQRLIKDPLEILLFKKTHRTQIHTANKPISISSVVVEDIYDQKCLSDYLLKTLKHSPTELLVDYLNSTDLDFSKS